MRNVRLANLSNCVVFFDFDNTITPFDVLDDIIKRFAVDNNWVVFERDWKQGRIGSKQCLENQLNSVRVTRSRLLKYLSEIKVDPEFHKIIDLMKKEGLRPVILSDSFAWIIVNILAKNRVKGAEVYANGLKFKQDRLIPSFPYYNPACLRCAHCKKKNLQKKDVRDKIIMYVGDGLSDVCPAECSDMVFAKSGGRLLSHFRKNKKLCIAYNNLEDIYNYFRGLDK